MAPNQSALISSVERGAISLRSEQTPLEEHHQLQLEENDRVNGGPPPIGIDLSYAVTHKAEVQLGHEAAVKAILRNEVLQRDGNQRIKAKGLAGPGIALPAVD